MGMAAASYVATSGSPTVVASAANTGASGNPSVTLPAGILAGDILIVYCGPNYSITTTPPTGWTMGSRTNTGSHNAGVIYTTAAGTESGTVITQGATGSEPWDCHALVVRGSSGVRAAYSGAGLSGPNLAYPAMTATTNDLITVLASTRSGGGTPTGWTGDSVTLITTQTYGRTGSFIAASTGTVPALTAVISGGSWTGVAALILMP